MYSAGGTGESLHSVGRALSRNRQRRQPCVKFDKASSGKQNENLRSHCACAQVAELADALDSGSSGRKVVEVRVLSWAP